MAVGFEPVASIRSRPVFHSALVIRTVSAAGGAPGATVTVAVRVKPNHRAVTVTVDVTVTVAVLRLNVAVALPALTTVSDGTCATAGLLLDSWTTAPLAHRPAESGGAGRGRAADHRGGVNDNELRDGPAGVAGLTDRFCVRRPLSGVAALMVVMVGGAAAFVVMVKVRSWSPRPAR